MKYLSTLLLSLFCFYLFPSSNAQAIGRIFPHKIKKARLQKHLGWMIVPFPISISGVGSTVMIAGGITNIYKGMTVGGGFSLNRKVPIDMAAILDIPVSNHVTGSVRFVNLALSSFTYKRSYMNANKLFQMQTKQLMGDVTLSYALWYDQIILDASAGYANRQTKNFFDSNTHVLGNIVRDKSNGMGMTLRSTFNIIDDVQNPTRGVIAKLEYTLPGESSNADKPKVNVVSASLSAYIPVSKNNVFMVNFFRSDSLVQSKGLLDVAKLKEKYGLQCDPASTDYNTCLQGEELRINNLLGYNQYGNASPLGGSNRLRSYPANRFTGAHTFYQGAEYRWNIPFSSLFNVGFMGGSTELLQFALFAERGTVSDKPVNLFHNYKSSYGAGIRILASSFIYRLDFATGSEGGKLSLIAGYPMSLGSPFQM